MSPPTQHEAGRVEEQKRTVEAKLRRIRLARRRLGEMDSTLLRPAWELVDAVLGELEKELQLWLGELS